LARIVSIIQDNLSDIQTLPGQMSPICPLNVGSRTFVIYNIGEDVREWETEMPGALSILITTVMIPLSAHVA